jgi:hypothetical protein
VSTLDDIVRAAIRLDVIESAAIFVVRPGSAGLDLGAAAGIQGPALDGLVAAVQQPLHPVARSVHDSVSTFDVEPVNKAGPALRSHLPLGGLGVLAVSHDAPLSAEARGALDALATRATAALDS